MPNKCLVRIVERNDGYLALCITCNWTGEHREKVTPASKDVRKHTVGVASK